MLSTREYDTIEDVCLYTGLSRDVVQLVLNRLQLNQDERVRVQDEKEPNEAPRVTVDFVNAFLLEYKDKVQIEAHCPNGLVLRIDMKGTRHQVSIVEAI